MIGNTASIYGSYMYPASDAPHYVPGGSANAAICILTAATAMLLRWVHKRENRKLEAAEAGSAEDGVEGRGGDQPASGFRYVY